MFGIFNTVPSISVNQLQEKVRNKSNLLDVRTSNEYQSGHIEQARNIPLNKIDGYKENITDELYVICQSGMRSKKATRILRKKGYNAINVRGGMNRWKGQIRGGK